MKKSIIALAVLAASGASMAQVTMTGKLGFSVNKAQSLPTPQAALNAGTQGMQMTDGEVTLQAAEDLGGGYKATATSTVLLRGRDTAVSAKDAYVALLTPVGQLTMGAGNSESTAPRAWAGATIALPGDAAGDNYDFFAFTTKLGPVLTTLSYTEGGTKDVNDLAANFGDQTTNTAFTPGTGVLTGPAGGIGSTAGSTTGNSVAGGPGAGGGPIQVTGISGEYTQGPLSLGVGFSTYALSVSGMSDPAARGLFKSGYDGRTDTAVSVSYDFGVAKVGLGFLDRNKGWAKETKAGISVPLGRLSLGLTYEHKTDDSLSLGDGVKASDFAASRLGFALGDLRVSDLKGTAERTKVRVGADYAFSKSTTLNVSYGTYQLGKAARVTTPLLAQGNNVTTTEYQVRLMKTF